MSTLNFRDIAANAEDYKIITPGEYDARIDRAEVTTSQAGNEMIRLRLVVETGPDAGQSMLSQLVFSPDNPKSNGATLRKLRTIGFDTAAAAARDDSLDVIALWLHGRRCGVRVVIEQYRGEDRNKIEAFLPAHSPGGPASPVPAPGPRPAAPSSPPSRPRTAPPSPPIPSAVPKAEPPPLPEVPF